MDKHDIYTGGNCCVSLRVRCKDLFDGLSERKRIRNDANRRESHLYQSPQVAVNILLSESCIHPFETMTNS